MSVGKGGAALITVLYADAQLCVALKPAGVSSEQDGLPRLLAQQLGETCYAVHRLDTPVGGVMLLAREASAAAALADDVAQRRIGKTYRAVVGGLPQPECGTLRDWLYHDARANKTYAVKKQRRGVREAVLDYTVLQTVQPEGVGVPLSLTEITLHTGRTHQIRAQFAAHGWPLAGDGRYGSRIKGAVALWSYRLRFTHPVTGEAMEFTAPPPQEGFWQYFGETENP